MQVLTSPDTYRMEPENAWQRLKTRVRKPKELAVLIEVAAWREREAQARDVPRSRVLKDEVIADIAVQAPTTIEKLKNLRSLPKGFERSRWGDAIVAAVERGLASDMKNAAAAGALAAHGKRHRRRRIAEGVVADDLGAPPRRRQGHRHGRRPRAHRRRRCTPTFQRSPAGAASLFGEKALALKHGKLALAIEHGKVAAVERH